MPQVDTSYDGLILCGGTDLHPSRFGEEIDGSVNIDTDRDEAEFALMQAYLDAGKPILGICRGHQLINVYFGGSLHQDMEDSVAHKRQKGCDMVHTVTAEPDSVLGKLYGTTFAVNSAHHQAVKALGKGLRATAIWDDRFVEAVEHETYPVMGVQWHPERMSFRNRREDTVCGEELLKYFIDLCRQYR